MTKKINIKGTEISIVQKNSIDFICLTDMVKGFDNSRVLIGNWLRKKDTLFYLGLWERLNNPDFKLIEFDELMEGAGLNRFTMSPQQWIQKTGAIGITSRSGSNGGTYAHKDIAFNFGVWLSPEFQLLLVKEFDRLKEEESKTKNIEWDYRRFLTKVNYRFQTDAVKENIIPKYTHITKEEEGYIYANEAELLNVAVFGTTSKKWRQDNVKAALEGKNIRDLATIPQLTVIASLESYNAILIKEGLTGRERFIKVKDAAFTQLKSLSEVKYTYPIESPHSVRFSESSSFDKTLKAVLSVPAPKKDDKK